MLLYLNFFSYKKNNNNIRYINKSSWILLKYFIIYFVLPSLAVCRVPLFYD